MMLLSFDDNCHKNKNKNKNKNNFNVANNGDKVVIKADCNAAHSMCYLRFKLHNDYNKCGL